MRRPAELWPVGVRLDVTQYAPRLPSLQVNFERGAEKQIGRPNAVPFDIDAVIRLRHVSMWVTDPNVFSTGVRRQQVGANATRSAGNEVNPEEVGLRVMPPGKDRPVLISTVRGYDQRTLQNLRYGAAHIEIENTRIILCVSPHTDFPSSGTPGPRSPSFGVIPLKRFR